MQGVIIMGEEMPEPALEMWETHDASVQPSNSPIKIAALKELTLALLEEVESLSARKTRGNQPHICLQEEVRRFEVDLIRGALKRTGGHQRRAARLLGIKVTTLNAKIKRYGIDPGLPAAGHPVRSHFDEPPTSANDECGKQYGSRLPGPGE